MPCVDTKTGGCLERKEMKMNEELYTEEQGTPLSEDALFLKRVFAPDGWGTMLMTPITKLEIMPEKIAAAFKLFLASVEVGKTFTMMELLTTPEMLFNRMEVIGKSGDGIYMLTEPVGDPHLRRSLLQNSVSGLCGLLLATHGAELTVPDGMSLEKMAYNRFLILRERDGERFCKTELVRMVRVGSLSPEKLRIRRGVNVTADFSLSELLPIVPKEMAIGSSSLDSYEQAFSGGLAYGCCCLLPGEYFVNLASNQSFDSFLAGGLGLFAAMMRYRFALPPMHCAPNGRIGLVVPRPYVAVGDSVFVFRPKCGGQENRPLPAELANLQRYLTEAVRDGKIKSILPLKKNASEMMEKLGGEEMEYCSERDFPTDCFAVLGILTSGSEAPGTKLGQFQFR